MKAAGAGSRFRQQVQAAGPRNWFRQQVQTTGSGSSRIRK
jgi:hypothetical protein